MEICTSSYLSPYPIKKVGDSPYTYPYPVIAKIFCQNGFGNIHDDKFICHLYTHPSQDEVFQINILYIYIYIYIYIYL